jgi:hypothetical protein
MTRLSSINRRVALTAGAVTAVAAAGLAAAPAGAAATTPIGPNQIFLGQVNGSSARAKFDVVCPGALNKGHPFGDTVGVMKLQDPIPGFGRTGNASAIAVTLIYSVRTVTVVEHVTRFTTYTSVPVSAKLVTPCGGTGTMTFTPVNGGRTAAATSVPVTFANVGTTR